MREMASGLDWRYGLDRATALHPGRLILGADNLVGSIHIVFSAGLPAFALEVPDKISSQRSPIGLAGLRLAVLQICYC